MGGWVPLGGGWFVVAAPVWAGAAQAQCICAWPLPPSLWQPHLRLPPTRCCLPAWLPWLQERDAFLALYPQGYHKTDKMVSPAQHSTAHRSQGTHLVPLLLLLRRQRRRPPDSARPPLLHAQCSAVQCSAVLLLLHVSDLPAHPDACPFKCRPQPAVFPPPTYSVCLPCACSLCLPRRVAPSTSSTLGPSRSSSWRRSQTTTGWSDTTYRRAHGGWSWLAVAGWAGCGWLAC